MRILFAVALVILAICHEVRSESKCDGDLSEALYQADAILLARIKKVTRQKSIVKYKISVSKVLKDANQEFQKRQRLVITQEIDPCESFAKVNSKRLLVVKIIEGKATLNISPQKPARKIQKLIKNLVCKGCDTGPVLHQLTKEISVKIYRWKNIKCRLSRGKVPSVTFNWYHNSEKLKDSENFKIRSKKSRSVLNIRGLPSTTGITTKFETVICRLCFRGIHMPGSEYGRIG